MAEMKAEAAVEGVEIGGLAENMVDLEVNSEVVGVKKIKEKRKMWRLRAMEEEVSWQWWWPSSLRAWEREREKQWSMESSSIESETQSLHL